MVKNRVSAEERLRKGTSSTDYFFNIIVKDTAGNKAVYATVLVHSLPEP